MEYEKSKPVRINISAETAKNYIFKYWEIIDLNTKEKIDNVIKIENPNSLKTSIEVLKETSVSVWIRPVCIEKL